MSHEPTVAEVVRARLQEQARVMRELESGAREADPRAVHRMRVAVRRMRSALASYRPFLDRERTEPLRAELRWLGGVLGEARDVEVMHARIASRLKAAGPLAVLEADTAARRVRARTELTAAFESSRYAGLAADVLACADDPPWSSQADRSAGALVERVRREWRRVERRLSEVPGSEDGSGHARDIALHEARKAVKRARYAGEPLAASFEGAQGTSARRFVTRAKRLQQVLGEHHDAAETRIRLHQLAQAGDGETGWVFGLLHGAEVAAGSRAEAELPLRVERARSAARGWF